MYMFNGKTNDGFYDMGLAVVGGIAERIEEEGVLRGGASDEFALDKKGGEGMDVDMDEKMGPGIRI
jgi:hypothetical protein